MFKLNLLVLFFLTTLLAGCGVASRGSGNVITLDQAIEDFDSVATSHGFQVDISQGDSFSVVIRIDDNLAEDVLVEKSGSTLAIGLQDSVSYSLIDVTLEADITMPELIGLKQSSGSHIDISGLNSSNALDVRLSGGSHLNGDIDAGDLAFDLSGGSHVTLSGAAGNLTVDVGGGSHANLEDLVVGDATVKANGGESRDRSSPRHAGCRGERRLPGSVRRRAELGHHRRGYFVEF